MTLPGWKAYHVIQEGTGRNLGAFDYPLAGWYVAKLTGERIVTNPDVDAVLAIFNALASDLGWQREPFTDATFTAQVGDRRARVSVRVELEGQPMGDEQMSEGYGDSGLEYTPDSEHPEYIDEDDAADANPTTTPDPDEIATNFPDRDEPGGGGG